MNMGQQRFRSETIYQFVNNVLVYKNSASMWLMRGCYIERTEFKSRYGQKYLNGTKPVRLTLA